MSIAPTTLWPFLKDSSKPVVVILGQTSSGKTYASIAIAHDVQKETGRGVEIVNADSRQLYKYCSIGTAKITHEEMQGIPHHLLDVLEPDATVTAAQYKAMATDCIKNIHDRGAVPMVVGGSMLYLRSITDGTHFADPVPPELREALERAYDTDGGTKLYQELQSFDPQTAQGFTKENKRYVIRAIEILRSTGRKPSSVKTSRTPDYKTFIIGIRREREELRRILHARIEAMFTAGWVDEVREILQRGYTTTCPALESHGYREIAAAVRDGHIDTEELTRDIYKKTWAYARRQQTWWRNDKRIHWIPPLT
jgi:tRNA dimethylallyltransferase